MPKKLLSGRANHNIPMDILDYLGQSNEIAAVEIERLLDSQQKMK
ncbi:MULTISPECIES: hypothetical protein [unclassified Methanosarcina]|jgi:hypothetical protein|nr:MULTISPECIES: hypothetical protein [unclassified Methanosarcina]